MCSDIKKKFPKSYKYMGAIWKVTTGELLKKQAMRKKIIIYRK
jgi:hypothetical protein